MVLAGMNEVFSKLNPESTLKFGIGEPMSWRGSYDEVAFPVVRNVSVAKCLENIEKAYTETFYGYKGGEYHYDDITPVNFEGCESAWTDGRYREDMIGEILGQEMAYDRDLFLAKLMTD